MKPKIKTLLIISGGLLTGFVNGLFGAGGGMLSVPILGKYGLKKKESHASAVAVIMPLSIFSATLYLLNGSVTINDAVKYVPWGLLGATTGTFILKQLPDKWIRKVFSIFMIWAGITLFMR